MNIYSLRWLLLPLVAVWLFETGRKVGHPFEVFTVLMLTVLSLGLLLTQMGRPLYDTLWVWSILFVFLAGYFFKSYWISNHLLDTSKLLYVGNVRWVTEEIIERGLHPTTAAFVTFCVTSWAVLAVTPPRSTPWVGVAMTDDIALRRYRRMVSWVLILAMVSIVTAIVQARLAIGIMGVDTARLPFRLDTLLFRTRSDVIPSLALLLIWVSDRPRMRNLWAASVLMLFLHWMVSGLLTTSRGATVEFLAPVMFLWFLTGKFRRSRKAIVIGAMLIAALLHPIVSHLRMERMQHSDGIMVALNKTLALWKWDTGTRSSVEAFTLMALRVTGSDSVWYAQEAVPTENSVARVRSILVNLPQYFTKNVVGLKIPADFWAPGLVGAFLVLGGQIGVVVFMVFYVLAVGKAWRWLSMFQAGPVVLSVFAYYILILSSGGEFYFPEVVGLSITILVCETAYKNWLLPVGTEWIAQRMPAPAMAPFVPQRQLR